MLDVKIKLLREGAKLPEYKTEGSAALDLSSASDTPITIPAGGRALIPTGIAIEPSSSGYVALVCARSGLASKHGICLSNGVGVIDSDYRGELCVPLCNLGDEEYIVSPYERIAQMMFLPVEQARLIPTDTLGDTERGSGGFGSTGK